MALRCAVLPTRSVIHELRIGAGRSIVTNVLSILEFAMDRLGERDGAWRALLPLLETLQHASRDFATDLDACPLVRATKHQSLWVSVMLFPKRMPCLMRQCQAGFWESA